MAYPDRPAYTTAVLNAGLMITDPVLQTAKPLTGKDGTPQMISGGVAVVYVFQDSGKNFAVKCWVSDIGDLRSHYQRVQAFLNTSRSDYFVAFAYVENGIIANSKKWPFLRMEWVGGKSLQEFVRDNIIDQSSLALLAERYLSMTERLHKLGVAHGDLQGSNIKVVGSGSAVDIKLIDYDTLIVPSAHGQNAKALALPSYQHPLRGKSPYYTGKEDYFSELVIYLSILAVAEKASLWSDYPKGDPDHDKEMLFVKEDFTAPRPTDVFKELYGLSALVRRLTVILWNYSRAAAIEQLLPLEEALKLANEAETGSSQARAITNFEKLLESSTSGGGSWLDDSAFVTQPSSSGTTKRGQTRGSAGKNFDDWLRDIAPTAPVPSADAASQAGTAPINPTQGVPFWPGLVVVGVFVFIAVLRIHLDPNDAGPKPTTDWRMDSRDGYVSTEARQESVLEARKGVFGSSNIHDGNVKNASDVTGYVVSKELFPINKPSPPPYVPILNVPSHRPLPSLPLPHSASQPIKPRSPDFSIYDASLLRFLQSEHPDWMAGLKQIPRPKYLGRLGLEQYLAVKFIPPDAIQTNPALPWYAQMRVRDQQWQALSPSTDYETKGSVIADFSKRYPASLETIEGVVSTYIEGLNSRRLADLFAIYSDDAIWVERGSKSTDRLIFEGNLRRTYETWPRSRVDVATTPEVAEGGADGMTSLQFRTRFRMENPTSGKWVEGTRSTRWQMKKVNAWRIVREETSLITLPYEGSLANAMRSGSVNRSTAPRVQEATGTAQARTVTPPRLRVVNVASDDLLALRMLPDSRARKLADIPYDATGIERTGESRLNGQDIWVPIRWNGINGWAHGNFLDYDGPD